MKLSAKLLTGLAFVALIGIAVVGLSNNSASAAVDGKVYVTNVASKLTTEAGNPSDATNHMVPTARTTATTVYGTYPSFITTGTSARDIVTNSNVFVVTVLDSDVNTTTYVTADNPAACSQAVAGPNAAGALKGCGDTGGGAVLRDSADGAGYDLGDPWSSDDILQKTGSGFDTTDDTVQVILSDNAANPIVGSISDIKVYIEADGLPAEHPGVRVVSIDSAGDGTNAPKITLGMDYGAGAGASAVENNGATAGAGVADEVRSSDTQRNFSIYYPTSAFDVITASVKSVVDTTGSVVTLTETGRNTGRFEGYVEVQERTARTTQGTGGNYCPTIVSRISWTGAPALCQGKVKGDTLANAATILSRRYQD